LIQQLQCDYPVLIHLRVCLLSVIGALRVTVLCSSASRPPCTPAPAKLARNHIQNDIVLAYTVYTREISLAMDALAYTRVHVAQPSV